MKEAEFYVLEDGVLRCILCPHQCSIEESKCGICGVRKNIGKKLVSLVYGRPLCLNIDPIEKKPLYHFLPGTDVLSLGTYGCNLFCKHCQNHEMSRGKYVETEYVTAEEVVRMAESEGIKSIAYTYNEPIVFYEYMYDIARLAKERGIKNVMVSNGFINPEPLKKLIPFLDGANIDLKSFNDLFYKKICGGNIDPVLESLKMLSKIWLEVTTLLIPGENDSQDEVRKMCRWLVETIGSDVPLHFSAFFPKYKMLDKEPTSMGSLIRAKMVAKEEGINYVYLGNVVTDHSIYCPECGKLVNDRTHDIYRCECGKDIPGVWN